MLANVNRIMRHGSDVKPSDAGNDTELLKDDAIKKYVLKTQSSSEDGEEEYVERYIVYDQKTGKETQISHDECFKYKNQGMGYFIRFISKTTI